MLATTTSARWRASSALNTDQSHSRWNQRSSRSSPNTSTRNLNHHQGSSHLLPPPNTRVEMGLEMGTGTDILSPALLSTETCPSSTPHQLHPPAPRPLRRLARSTQRPRLRPRLHSPILCLLQVLDQQWDLDDLLCRLPLAIDVSLD